MIFLRMLCLANRKCLLILPAIVMALTAAGNSSFQLGSLSFPKSARTGINTIYIPFTMVGRLIVVEASADGLAGNFIVDTGSERLLINKVHFSGPRTGAQVTSSGNTGMMQAIEHKTDSLKLDQLAFYDLIAHVVDLSHIEIKKNTRFIGILGYNVFREFELFIDFPNARLVLGRTNKEGNKIDPQPLWENPYDSLTFDLRKHFIILKAVVNHVPLELILDSGAELNLIDRKVNRKVLENFRIIKRVNLIGVGKKQVEVLAGVLKDVGCGNQITEEMNTLLTSMDEINTSFGLRVDGVLGYEFLHSRRTVINYRKKKLYFIPPSRS